MVWYDGMVGKQGLSLQKSRFITLEKAHFGRGIWMVYLPTWIVEFLVVKFI